MKKKILKLALMSLLLMTSSCDIHIGGSSSSSSSSISSSQEISSSSSSSSENSSLSESNSSESSASSSDVSSSESSSSISSSSNSISSEISSSESSSSSSKASNSSSESSFDWVSSMESSSVNTSIDSSSENSSFSSSEEEVHVYTLTYVYNDGATLNKTIKSLTEIPTLEVPSREGYSFEGWYYDESYSVKVNKGDTLEENTTIYACWKEKVVEQAMYEVSFESSEGYTASTTYNNPAFKVIGEKIEWSVSMGTPSTTSPINGEQSLQMRFYSSKADKIGSLMSNYSFDEATSVSFYAKSTDGNKVKVSKSSDGVIWTNSKIFDLTTTGVEYEYVISSLGEDVYLKFDLVLPSSPIDKSKLIIDDIKVYGDGVGINKENNGDIGDYDMSSIPLSKEIVFSELSNTGVDNGGVTEENYNLILNTVNSYYASIDSTYTGETLWNALNEATSIPSTQIRSYGELKYDLLKTDYSTSDSTKIVDMYSGLTFNGTWNADVWNREHIWCQSHSWYEGVGESTRNAGTDLHHIRPLYSSINSSRNNSFYGEVSARNTKAKYFNTTDTVNATASNGTLYGYLDDTIDPTPGTEINEGVFEPTDRVKGDVARILMYILIRYPNYIESYPITNIIYTSEGTISSAYALLLKWHQQDPVSNFEIRRNQKTYEIQGNRNPFIDNPTYADLIFRNL